ncbi:MAG: ABC transporter permease [Saprospiraceae bacterium]
MGVFDKDKWQEIFGTIKKNKLRTMLTALGVFWGIFMLVFLLGMGKGLENGVYRDFGSGAKNIMYTWASRTTMPYKGLKPGRRVKIKLDDIAALYTEVPELAEAAPRNTMGNIPMTYKAIQENFELRGELTNLKDMVGLMVHKGRYLNQKDIEQRRKVVALGTEVKKVLFGDSIAVGAHVQLRGIDFKVIGVYGPRDIKDWTRDDMESAVIPLTTMGQTFGTNNEIDRLICQPKEGISVAKIEPKIRSALKKRHNIHPEDPDGIGGFNLEKEFEQIQSLFLGIQIFLWFVGVGTLLAGIIGVSNIMLIIVKERTKEIGIRKAMGATPGSIINMILTESIFITALSGYIGLALGSIIIGGVSYLMVANDINVQNFYNPEVNLGVAVFALLVLVIAGTLAGLAPAIHASKINPVEALKDE